jgi:hypothetical protein
MTAVTSFQSSWHKENGRGESGTTEFNCVNNMWTNEPFRDERPVKATPRKHEFAIEILKLLTSSLSFTLLLIASVKQYPWLSKPWVFYSFSAVCLTVVSWFAKPRVVEWIRRGGDRTRERQFVATKAARLHELVEHFSAFTALTDSRRSLLFLVREAYGQVQKSIAG